ncbi:hypothetical protein HMPREF1982_03064 [Clostridiales bacterium oral taxon 876 str. F0540]|nr:hypothetical protein HMPREF1982_03064 [Clostridiales bacterium oral taxon 876 str. F0540]
MSKKLTFYLIILVFAAIFGYHLVLNINNTAQPPSQTWGKELLVSTGDDKTAAKIMGYKDNYIIAHNYENKIKILSVDKLGKKIKEQTFNAVNGKTRNVGLLTDGANIYMNWIEDVGETKNLEQLTLDKDFIIKDKKEIADIDDKTQISDDILLINFKDRIEINNIKLNNSVVVSDDNPRRVSGTKVNDKYIVSYCSGTDLYNYFYIQNGQVSKTNIAGHMPASYRMSYTDSKIVTDGKFGYILNQYSYFGLYGGISELKFQLDSDKEGEVQELTNADGYRETISDITVNTYDGKGEILGSNQVPMGKKKAFPNICEYTIVDGAASNPQPVSRTRVLSLHSDIAGDAAVFCDFEGGKSNIYMTSKNIDFKNANNGRTIKEYKYALQDTFEEILFVIGYIFPYGTLWLIPSICIAALACLIEYKLKDRFKKIAFLAVYFTYLAIKSFFIYSVSLKRYAYFLPEHFTPLIGEILVALISILCCIHAYRKYSEDMETNVIAKNATPAFIIDTFLTLMIFVPFIK